MNATAKTATNEDVLKYLQGLTEGQARLEGAQARLERNQQDMAQNMHDLAQMTSEGLDAIDHRIEGTNERMDGIEGETRLLKGEVKDLKQASYRHELQLAEFAQTQNRLDDLIHIDIREILERLTVIEERPPIFTQTEVRKLKNLATKAA